MSTDEKRWLKSDSLYLWTGEGKFAQKRSERTRLKRGARKRKTVRGVRRWVEMRVGT